MCGGDGPRPCAAGAGAAPFLPALALWAGLLVCVLRGFGSQLALWRLLSERGLWFFPRLTDQAVYKRLRSARCWRRACRGRSARGWLPSPRRWSVSTRVRWTPWRGGSLLYAGCRRASRLLPGKLAGVFSSGAACACTAPPKREGGRRELVAGLPPRTLVVADLGYFGFACSTGSPRGAITG